MWYVIYATVAFLLHNNRQIGTYCHYYLALRGSVSDPSCIWLLRYDFPTSLGHKAGGTQEIFDSRRK